MSQALKAIVRKEWLHILRVKGVLPVALIMPVMFTIIFSKIMTMDVKSVKIVAVVPHHTQASHRLIARFEANSMFQFEGYCNTMEDAKRLMRHNSINAIIVLRPDYDKQAEQIRHGDRGCKSPIQIVIDASDCVVGAITTAYVKAVIGQELDADDDFFMHEILYNPRLLNEYTFVPGLVAFVIFLFVHFLTAACLVREKESGTIDSLILSPVSLSASYAVRSSVYFFLGLIIAVLTMLTACFVVGLPVRGSILAMCMITLIFVAQSVALGLLVSLLCRNQINAYIVVVFVSFFFFLFFGGVAIPVDNLPQWAQRISDVLFIRWYIDAMHKLMIQGVDILYILKETLFISISTAVTVVACHLKIKFGQC